jgi:hypothetical protein
MTDRTPDVRAKELSRATGVAAPFKIEFAKKVNNPGEKEKKIHSLLEHYENRYSSNREFFEVKLEVVKAFFDLLDGEEWKQQNEKQEEEEEEEEEKEKEHKKKSRYMRDYFKDNQKIRHKFGIDKIIVGSFNYEKNCIVFNNTEFTSLSGFGKHHYDIENKKNRTCNGWDQCEVYEYNVWIKIPTVYI